MTRSPCLLCIATAAALIMPALASAQDRPFAAGINLGSSGVGVQGQYSLSPRFVVRGGYDMLRLDRNNTYDGIDYSAEVKFDSTGVFVDWHPTGGGFFVSGGAYFGRRDIHLDATPDSPTQVGGVTFTPEQIGSLTGKIELESNAPFVGLGYDNTFTRGGRWGLRILAGAAFGDGPRVNLDASGGTLSDTPFFQQQLTQEEAEIQEEADNYKILPVVQVGLTYRF
jgi:hypothetical protein